MSVFGSMAHNPAVSAAMLIRKKLPWMFEEKRASLVAQLGKSRNTNKQWNSGVRMSTPLRPRLYIPRSSSSALLVGLLLHLPCGSSGRGQYLSPPCPPLPSPRPPPGSQLECSLHGKFPMLACRRKATNHWHLPSPFTNGYHARKLPKAKPMSPVRRGHPELSGANAATYARALKKDIRIPLRELVRTAVYMVADQAMRPLTCETGTSPIGFPRSAASTN